MKSSYSMVDLFSGCGGASLGFKLAGCRVVGAVDIDHAACEFYSKNVGIEPIEADIEKVKGSEILDHYGLKEGDVDFVVGCPPCQGFSSLRRTRGLSEDERNGLIAVFIERVREILPKVVVFENVPGIATLYGGKYLNVYLDQMREIGYESVYKTLNAADYGVPQFRKRVVVFSVKDAKSTDELSMPSASHSNPKCAEENGKLPWSTVRNAISMLPPLESGESDPSIPNHKARMHTPRILEIIRNIPKDGGSRKDLGPHLWLKCHRELDSGGAENVYGRMCWDWPAPTMTSRCTSPSSGRFIHPEQDRAITHREAANLQTFPNYSVFPDNASQADRLIGNAVPAVFLGDLVRRFIEDHYDLL